MQERIRILELCLGVIFPETYRKFLSEKGSAFVDGFQVMGFATEVVKFSLKKATRILRALRPDLSRSLVPIIFIKNMATCLDLSRADLKDAPLVEVDLENKDLPFELKSGFAEWLDYHERMEKRVRQAMNRIANRQNELVVKKVVGNWKDVVREVFGDVDTEASLLRQQRPELPKTIIAIKVDGDQVFCLDLARATAKDAPVVKVSTAGNLKPIDLGQNLSQWLVTDLKKKNLFSVAVNKADFLQKDAGTGKISDWSTPIFRVQDYIVALGAFRFSRRFNCLEVDEFFSIDQPHLEKGEAFKVLLAEAFARARDYTGSLAIKFTRDSDEDENGVLREGSGRRVPTALPPEIISYAAACGVELSRPEKGFISHEDAVRLWFGLLKLPEDVVKKVSELEEAGYLKREMLAEVVALGQWTREEVIWIFSNAPRPEAVVFGSDNVDDRIAYRESLNYARAAVLAGNLRNAVMAGMSGGFQLEEVEDIKISCQVIPQKAFWYLTATGDFYFPEFWLRDGARQWYKANEPVLLLCRPHMPGTENEEIPRLEGYLDILTSAEEKVQAKCLVLGNEYNSPYYCKYLAKIGEFVERAKVKGVHVIFAPTRTDLYLDEKIQGRMSRVKSMTNFPSRQEEKKLQIIEVPKEMWNVPDESIAPRAINNAWRSAVTFAEQIAQKRELKNSEKAFSLMCEVMEREAWQNYPVLVEVDGRQGDELLASLRRYDRGMKEALLPFVQPADMPGLISKIEDKKLLAILEKVEGGIVIISKLWEYQYATPKKIVSGKICSLVLPAAVTEAIDLRVRVRIQQDAYASYFKDVYRAHKLLRQSLTAGMQFPIASISPESFMETIRDYIFEESSLPPADMRIAYNDGTKGGSFPLFLLPRFDCPKTNGFFPFSAGMVSMRHSESDRYMDRYFIRNRDIQHRSGGANQEELAMNKVWECVEELMRYIRGEINSESEYSASLRILLVLKPELSEKKWQGLDLNIFQSTGLESATVGTYRAVIGLINKYRGELVVTPRILIRNHSFKAVERWY
jgi:hypothetical protein